MATQKTIYIVDDDEDDLFLMQEAISDLKLDLVVRPARNGSELMQILDKNIEPALILIDVNMPVMNGIEALNAVYADPDCRHIRSILMSTSNAAELHSQALNSGAMKFICKPPHYDGFLALMTEVYHKCF